MPLKRMKFLIFTNIAIALIKYSLYIEKCIADQELRSPSTPTNPSQGARGQAGHVCNCKVDIIIITINMEME